MARPDPVPTSPNLLSIIDHPKLPALIRKLSPPALSKLVGTVGVEDAGAIMAMTTPGQMREVFDDLLWRSAGSGLSARFSIGEFLRWLDVLNHEGAAFAARRMHSLGEQFLSAALGPVLDVHAKGHQLGGQVALDDREDFGDFLVRTRPGYDDHWDTVRTTLAALNDEHPRFLDRVLSCCTPTWTGFVSERPYVQARIDESGDRDERREQAGFVNPDTAAAFLDEARLTPMAALIETEGYDALSARYLARQSLGDANSAKGSEEADIELSGDEELVGLLTALGRIEGVSRAPRLLGPDGAQTLTIKDRLVALERDQLEAFTIRMGELIFLANVLMAGISCPELTESEAPNVALGVCNLGSGLAGQTTTGLVHPGGLVRLFRIGWHALCQLPPVAARRLVAVLRDPAIRARLDAGPWILSEVDLAITDLVNRVDLAAFDDVGDSLGIISLVVEAEAIEWLRALIAELPRLPSPPDHVGRVSTKTRDIDDVEDLTRVEVFLSNLPTQTKS